MELFTSDKQHVLDLYCSKGKNCSYKFYWPSFGIAYGNPRFSELGKVRESDGLALGDLKDRLQPQDAIETTPGGDEYIVTNTNAPKPSLPCTCS